MRHVSAAEATAVDPAHRITGIGTGIEYGISICKRDGTVQQIAVWWQGRFTAGPIGYQNGRVMYPPPCGTVLSRASPSVLDSFLSALEITFESNLGVRNGFFHSQRCQILVVDNEEYLS